MAGVFSGYQHVSVIRLLCEYNHCVHVVLPVMGLEAKENIAVCCCCWILNHVDLCIS